MLSVCDWLIVDHVSLSWNLFLDNHSDEVQTFTCTHNVYIVYVVVQSQVVVLMIGGQTFTCTHNVYIVYVVVQS